MKRLLLGLCLASGLCFVGCTKSVTSEVKDLHDAQKAKAEKVDKEIRDVQDAARQGDDKIIKEARDVEDAKKRDAERAADGAPIAPAPVTPPAP